jgi:Cys-rich repeat protein
MKNKILAAFGFVGLLAVAVSASGQKVTPPSGGQNVGVGEQKGDSAPDADAPDASADSAEPDSPEFRYTGRLETEDGPVSDEVTIEFSLYDSQQDGERLWTETHSSVSVKKGTFSTVLGDANPIRLETETSKLWLQITVDGERLEPRTQLSDAAASSSPASDESGDSKPTTTPAAGSIEAMKRQIKSELRAEIKQDIKSDVRKQVIADLEASGRLKSSEAQKGQTKSASDESSGENVNYVERRAELDETQENNLDDLVRNTIKPDVDNLKADMAVVQDKLSNIIFDDNYQGHKAIIFRGVNVHVENGQGNTMSSNGVGNLVVGYDEGTGTKDGSHNIVIGKNHEYQCIASFVSGSNNKVYSPSSAAVGGQYNTVDGDNSATVAGNYNRTNATGAATLAGGKNASLPNIVNGENAAIVGGDDNTANAENSVILAGGKNTTESSGSNALIAGGTRHTTKTEASMAILGGRENTATQHGSTVVGGWNNQALNNRGTAVGGKNNKATAFDSTVVGGLSNETSGTYSTVTGGKDNEASSTQATVTGGRNNVASGNNSLVIGGNAATESRSDTVSSGGDIDVGYNYFLLNGAESTEYQIRSSDNESSGIAVRPTNNPGSGNSLFTVESTGNATRFRVSHDGDDWHYNGLSVDRANSKPSKSLDVGGFMNMHNNRIINLADPVNPQDAANKRFVNSTIECNSDAECASDETCVSQTCKQDCTLDGTTRSHGDSATFYSTTSVNCDYDDCAHVGQSRTCLDGSYDGSSSYDQSNCNPVTCSGTNDICDGGTCVECKSDGDCSGGTCHSNTCKANCTFDGNTYEHNESFTAHKDPSGCQNCTEYTLSCTDGVIATPGIGLDTAGPCPSDDCGTQNCCSGSPNTCKQCCDNTDCTAPDDICDGGSCVECINDSDCGSGEYCGALDGVCYTCKSASASCISNSQCCSGSCTSGTCDSIGGGTCGSPPSCPSGSACCDGTTWYCGTQGDCPGMCICSA